MLKLDKNLIARFERTQTRHGTRTALYNFMWELAAEILKGAGVTRITTRTAA